MRQPRPAHLTLDPRLSGFSLSLMSAFGGLTAGHLKRASHLGIDRTSGDLLPSLGIQRIDRAPRPSSCVAITFTVRRPRGFILNQKLSIVLMSFLVSSGLAGCGDATPETCGAPGGTQGCMCSGATSGAQKCGDDGTWGICECGTLQTDASDGDAAGTDISGAETTAMDVPALPGCTDSDASNFDAAATTDDASCLYDVTFSVNTQNAGLDVGENVDVGGSFQANLGHAAWCATCTPLTDDGSRVWSTTVALPPGTYQHRFLVESWPRAEEVPEACGVTANGFINRTFVVADAPVALELHRFGACTCTAETCSGLNACNNLNCENRFVGNYAAGRLTIETDRNNCTSKIGIMVAPTGGAWLYGVDPTTGEAHFSFHKVQCTTPFRGSALNMTIDIEPENGGLTVSAPNIVSGSLRLVFKHATFTKAITSTFSGTISGGRVTGTLTGLPQSVNIGLDTNVTAGTFAAPE